MGVSIESVRFMELHGQTKGTSSMVGSRGFRTEKVNWSLSASSSKGFSSVKKVAGNLCFPEYRKPSVEVVAKINEFDTQIQALQKAKSEYLLNVFDEQEIMKVSDLPPEYFGSMRQENIETYKEIIKKRKIEYNSYNSVLVPTYFSKKNGELIKFENDESVVQSLVGNPVSPGKIKGRIRIFKDFSIFEGLF